jgi:hypothetical protein
MVIRRRSVLRRLAAWRLPRILTVLLMVVQVLTAIPRGASAVSVTPSAPASVLAPSAPQVTVNRTVPAVVPPPAEPQFSPSPTTQEISRARVFPEPLVPIGGEPTTGENLVLAQALLAFHRSAGIAWQSTLGPFLLEHPASPWRASLLANLGTVQLRAHAYSRALASWNEAWILARDVTEPRGRAVADGALAEWLTLAASLGQIEAAQARLAEIGERSITGSASGKVTAARETIALIARHPEKTIPCGPEALLALLAFEQRAEPGFLRTYVPTSAGTSLSDLADLAALAGLALHPAYRESATDIPIPAVVHLKVGHYIAITEHVGDRYRVVDRSLVDAYWISRDTLLDESSGYVLIPGREVPAGWRAVTTSEGATNTGRGPE